MNAINFFCRKLSVDLLTDDFLTIDQYLENNEKSKTLISCNKHWKNTSIWLKKYWYFPSIQSKIHPGQTCRSIQTLPVPYRHYTFLTWWWTEDAALVVYVCTVPVDVSQFNRTRNFWIGLNWKTFSILYTDEFQTC